MIRSSLGMRDTLVRRLAGGIAMGAVAVLAGMTSGMSGCAKGRGVEVYNATDHVINVEQLTVDSSGETTVYATAILNRDGTFSNKMETAVRGQLMRARFTLTEDIADENNWVMINLPADKNRYFDLVLQGTKLRVVENTRGAPKNSVVAKERIAVKKVKEEQARKESGVYWGE